MRRPFPLLVVAIGFAGGAARAQSAPGAPGSNQAIPKRLHLLSLSPMAHLSVGPGKVMLLYGAAGAVGQIMTPWAKHLGAFVIGVVSSGSSISTAKASGCDAVLIWGVTDLAAEVTKLTGGAKADVVYDPMGPARHLRLRWIVSGRAAYSCHSALRPGRRLRSRSGRSTPGIALPDAAISFRLYSGCSRIPGARRRGAGGRGCGNRLVFSLGSFTLAEVSDAHAALEGGKSSGAIVLRP